MAEGISLMGGCRGRLDDMSIVRTQSGGGHGRSRAMTTIDEDERRRQQL